MSFEDSSKALSLKKNSGCSPVFFGYFLIIFGAVFGIMALYQNDMLFQIFWAVLGAIIFFIGLSISRIKPATPDDYQSADTDFQMRHPQIIEALNSSKPAFPKIKYNPEKTELNDQSAPLAIGIVLLIFGGIWNGFVLFGLSDFLRKGWNGVDIIGLLFLIPFALVGLGILLGGIYYLMANYNPRAKVWLKPGTIPIGEAAELEWEFDKPVNNYFEMIIRLIGEERATYTRGTDRVTDTHKFHDQDIFQTVNSTEMQRGKLDIRIPPNCMYSFKTNNNEIQWRIELVGKVKMWPDLNMSLPVTVTPLVQHLVAEQDDSDQSTSNIEELN